MENINFIDMFMEYKVFRLANLSGPIYKQVNLSEFAGETYLAIDTWFMHSKVAKAAYFLTFLVKLNPVWQDFLRF